MKLQEITQQLEEVPQGTAVFNDDTKRMLSEINEKLSILIDLQRARCPPEDNEQEQPTTERRIISRPDGTQIDVTWILRRPMYDNSQFCRIFNIQPPTSQKWRSQKKIEYFKIGSTVWYLAEQIIHLIETYVSKRPFTITEIAVCNDEDF